MTAEGVFTKAHIARENLERLAQLSQHGFEEWSSDFRNVDSTLHRLQTTIQALIDLASFACAAHALGPAATSRELLSELVRAGHLPAGSVETYGPIFGFRNRVVHLYDRIDERIVYRILQEHRADLTRLLELLLVAIAAGMEESPG